MTEEGGNALSGDDSRTTMRNPPIKPLTTPALETRRLRLRLARHTDAARIQQLFPHWEILKYMTAAIPWPYPADGAQQYLDRALRQATAGERYSWAITLREADDDLAIGMIELFPANPEDNRGFWIGRDYQRRGYMTEAAAAVNDFAFDALGLAQLILNNAEPNAPSHRLKEKSGARIIEVRDDVLYVGGAFREIRWRLTSDDWKANRERFLRADQNPSGECALPCIPPPKSLR